MIKNIIIAILALTCLGLAIFVVSRDDRKTAFAIPQAGLDAAPGAAVAETTVPAPEPEPVPVPEPAPVEVEPADLASAAPTAKDDKELLEDANDLIAMLVEDREGLEEEKKELEENNPFLRLKKMMDDPEMRKTMEASVGGQVDMMYGGFFDRNDLDADSHAALSKLLRERQAGNMSLGFSMMTASKEERDLETKNSAAREEAFRKSLTEVLGEEGVAGFEQWEKEMPHRQTLKQAATNLRGEHALSETQEEELVQLMMLRNEEFDAPGFAEMKPGMAPGKEEVEALIKQHAKRTELYVQDAKVVLTEGQHEAYAAALLQQQKMAEMGLRMGAQMFRGADEEE